MTTSSPIITSTKAATWRRVALVVLSLWAVGCSVQPYATDARLDKGLVLVLTSASPRKDLVCQRLVEGGLDWAIETVNAYDSVSRIGMLGHEALARCHADRVGQRLAEYAQAYPGRRVILVAAAHSGQLGINTTAALGDQLVDGVILIFPEVPSFNPLDEALAHTRQGILCLASPQARMAQLDFSMQVSPFIHPIQTATSGGFILPTDPARAAAYDKLHQIVMPRTPPVGDPSPTELLHQLIGNAIDDHVIHFITAPHWSPVAANPQQHVDNGNISPDW